MTEVIEKYLHSQLCADAGNSNKAYRFCDEVILLHQGKVAAYGETQAVLTAENLAKTFQIQAEIDLLKREISQIEKLR